MERAAGTGGPWTLLEPRRQAAAFLGVAVEALGLDGRVRIVRERLGEHLSRPSAQELLESTVAVTLRAVRLSRREWRGLAAGLSVHGRVVWPTTAGARERADLPKGAFEEEAHDAARGIVWIGRRPTGS